MVLKKTNGHNVNMEELKAELRQIKKALGCQDKKVRELTTRLETETEDKMFLSHQNKYLSAEIKKMQTRRLGKKRELDNLRDANEQLPRAQKPLTAAQTTEAQTVCTAQHQCQGMQDENEMQLESTDDKIQTLEKLIQSLEATLQEKTQQLAQCLEEAEQQSHDFKEIMKHAEEDEVKKIHEIKLMTEKKLQTEKETNIKLKAEMTIMTQRFSNFQKHFDEKGTEMYTLKQEKQQLLGLTRSQQSEIEDLKEQNEKTSQEKDGTILGLKQKNQELEGLRFIHDLKFSELKKQFEPQQDEIKEKRESIGQLQEKLRQTGNNYNTLTLITSDLRLKLKAEGTELHNEIQKMKNLETHLQRLKSDLHNCVNFIQEPKKLKDSVLMIYARYVSQTERQEISNVDRDAQRAVYRQRDCLERTINSLRMRLAKSAEEHQKIYTRINKDNVSMIKEINELHIELCLLRTQVKDGKAQLALNKKSNYLRSQVRGRTQK
ncbi:cilia- and flagella-associated protein 57-like [Hippoglossus hippoglossus]|uniref:cilia- and flagella-associated protein 57-like n=1 Tax=Hippoglossus hippoglossus TaxID=8267 RepID=UPI00148B7942|nr:cilia- and flagella-associated protein 57-like [Hippoglossus hippoglossus]XP_035030456.1 cilia- and flagella-associated protein 57-like [Hippoglossus stenolepis]